MIRAKIIPGANKKELARILEISGSNIADCMQCGKCSASCPAATRMDVLPHQVVRLLQTGQIQRVADSETIWNCASCFTCSARCPRGVDPAKLIEAIRLTVIRRTGNNRLKTGDIPRMVDDAMPQQAIVSAYRKFNK